MGRKTWLSLGRALPNRRNIVLTHRMDFNPEQAETFHHEQEVIELSKQQDIFVIGGAELFSHYLPKADYLYLTYIDASFRGDTYFPPFDEQDWTVIQETALCTQSGYQLRFCIYMRKN